MHRDVITGKASVVRHYYLPVAFIVFGFVLRFILLLAETPPLRSDSLTYHNIALSILRGEYSLGGYPTAFVVPGYPVFLAVIYKLFGDGQTAVRFFQVVTDILTVLLFTASCRMIFDKRYALTAGAVFALFPSNILYTQTILTETLFGLFSVLILYQTLGRIPARNLFVTGMLFGAALLVRSSFVFCCLFFVVYLIVQRKYLFADNGTANTARKIALFLAGIALVLSPWLIRNKLEMGEFVLATQGGSTLWEGNNPHATGTWNKQMVEANPLFEEKDEIKRDKEFRKQAIEFIVNNPLKFIELGIKKTGYLFSSERMILLYFAGDPEGATSTGMYRKINPVYLAAVNLPYFALITAGLWGLLLNFKGKFIVIGFTASWILTMFIFVSLSRYHYVLIPFFTIGAVNLLRHGLKPLRQLKPGMIMAGAVCTLFLAAVWAVEFYLLYFGGK